MTSASTSKQILILGYGEMGHAFEALLADHHTLAIWSRQREQQGLCELATEVARADLIIFCLPVMAHAAIATRLAPLLPATTHCLTIAKGVDDAARPAFQILQTHLPEQAIATIYGPMIAEELIMKRPGFAQLTVVDSSRYELIAQCFHSSHLYLEPSSDLVGTSWSVILKNVYALLIGIADGLQLGDNMRGFLLVRSLQELSSIVVELGGDAHTPYALAGLGDLVTTATSVSSHHHALGIAIGSGAAVTLAGEGVHSLQSIVAQRPFAYDQYPLFVLVHQILLQPQQSAALFAGYIHSLKNTDK